ncbi:MAG TPA: energy-coupling factor transporter transmembrane component T, partial [Smithellaceae bacterium]|nr:energy-coupling factor transporter transmembrane component T [Smithellaceae bacterium]
MIRLGQYYEGSSFGHCLDARVKIIATLLFSLLIFYARGWNILLISGFLFAVCRVSRLNFIRILEAGKTIIWFALLLFALHIFFTAGSPLCVIPYLNFTITAEGVTRGLLVSWQFVALAYSGIILTMITSPTDLVHGLEFILRPLRHIRVPVSEIALMVSMALRFVPTILEEYDRIKTAQLARGSEMETARYD